MARVCSFIGWSGVGKTTFLERLIAHMKARGLRVAMVKEVPKPYTLDVPGKDTYRFGQAGADVVCIANPQSAAMMLYRPVSVAELIASMPEMDVILTEGHHKLGYPQIEIYRKAVAGGLRCPDTDNLRAVITVDEIELPQGVLRFGFDDLSAVTDFILNLPETEN